MMKCWLAPKFSSLSHTLLFKMELLNDEGNMDVLMGKHHKAKVVADVVANNRSDLQRDRLAYSPPLPKILSGAS